nr:hypothetical protein [Tanacetum cinerariifolium]
MVPQDYDVSSATTCLSIHVIYVMYCLYIRSLSVMLSRISFHVLIRQRGVTILVSEPGYETVGSKDLTCVDWMVNTRTDTDLSAAVQNALQAMLPQIREEIREESRTGSGSLNAVPVDAENWISHMEKIFDVMGCEDAFKTRLAVYKFEGNALAWWKAYKQAKGGDAWLVTTSSETSTKFMQRFLRLAGFLGAAAGTEEEQAKNFQWGLRRSTLNHLMCMSYTDVAQVANAARNYEILHERDMLTQSDQISGRGVVIGISRPLSRVVTGVTVRITTVTDLTGVVAVTTTAAAIITTTLAVTTG